MILRRPALRELSDEGEHRVSVVLNGASERSIRWTGSEVNVVHLGACHIEPRTQIKNLHLNDGGAALRRGVELPAQRERCVSCQLGRENSVGTGSRARIPIIPCPVRRRRRLVEVPAIVEMPLTTTPGYTFHWAVAAETRSACARTDTAASTRIVTIALNRVERRILPPVLYRILVRLRIFLKRKVAGSLVRVDPGRDGYAGSSRVEDSAGAQREKYPAPTADAIVDNRKNQSAASMTVWPSRPVICSPASSFTCSVTP